MTTGENKRRPTALSRLVAAAKREYDYPHISLSNLKTAFDDTVAEITNIASGLQNARQNSAQDEPVLVELQRLMSTEGGHIHRGATIPLLKRFSEREADLDVLKRQIARAEHKLKTLQSQTWVLFELPLDGLRTQQSKLDALLTRLEQTQRYSEQQAARLHNLTVLADAIERLANSRVLLNTGYRALALKDLLAEAYGPNSQPAARRVALAILSRWAKANEVGLWREIFDGQNNLVKAWITEAEGKTAKPDINLKSNEYFRAGSIETLLEVSTGANRDRDTVLLLGNQIGRAVQALQEDERYRSALQVTWLNSALALDDLEPVSVFQGEVDIFDRLDCGIEAQHFIENGPLVSVLVPAFNSQEWLPTAINSLLNQTWRNLEIVIVDDQSTDNTFEVAKAFAAKHPRVTALQNNVNAGPYVARNLALNNSSGVFVTVHDADDWSHPRKIERQVYALLNRPNVVANTSQCVRVDPRNLQVLSSAGKALRLNYSSLMFRRFEVCSALGFWDPVRFGADSEFIARIEAFFGTGSIDHLESGALSLVRSVETSLTAGGLNDRLKGARRLYRRLFTEWHAKCSVNPDDLRVDPQAVRRFYAPQELLGLAQPTEALHLVFIDDLSELGTQYLIKALEERQLLQARCGYVHVPNPLVPMSVESPHLIRHALEQNLVSVRLLHDEYGKDFKLRSQRTIITAACLLEKYNLMAPFESKSIEVLFETENQTTHLSQILKNCVTTLGSQPTALLAKNVAVKEALKPAEDAGWDVRLF